MSNNSLVKVAAKKMKETRENMDAQLLRSSYFKFWLCYFVEDILSISWSIVNSSGTVFRDEKPCGKFVCKSVDRKKLSVLIYFLEEKVSNKNHAEMVLTHFYRKEAICGPKSEGRSAAGPQG